MARVFAVLSGFCAAGHTALALPAADAAHIAGGVVEGFLSDQPDLKTCIVGSATTVKDVDMAVQDFEKRDAADVAQGLRLLADALDEFPTAMKSCKAAEADVKRIEDALEQIHSPRQFAYHFGKDLLVNHHDIFMEIKKAVADYKAKSFEDFGVQIGTALRKVIVGSTAEERFEEFLAANHKIYTDHAERAARLAAFTANLEHIGHFQEADEGSAKYSHLSPFADLSMEEFSLRHGLRSQDWVPPNSVAAVDLDLRSLPDSFDWRAKGAVNEVKNQAQCGSCWAFATVANIEGAGFVSTGKLVSLSEQELVDCDTKTGDQGCQGGLPSNAFKDMIENQMGLELESQYPYLAADGQCHAAKAKEVAFISGWQQISTNEDQIAAALVKYGPLAIGINAGPMQFYHGGISSPWRLLCNPRALDHGVALVGFGKTFFKKYWIIRNSWGKSWGENGYYRIVRGRGACGLNTMVSTATGVTIKSAESADTFVV